MKAGLGSCHVAAVLGIVMGAVVLGGGRPAPAQPSSSPWFRDVTGPAGLEGAVTVCGTSHKRFIVEGNGSGCAWLDFDRDGWSDLYIVKGMSLDEVTGRAGTEPVSSGYLFRNNRDGTFTDRTRGAGLQDGGRGNGVVVADYDNDGNLDLFVTNYGEDLLYRNLGNGTFEDVTARAGVGGGPVWSTGATFGDFNLDGWVDLYVVRYLEFDFADPPLEGEYCNFRGFGVMCGPLGLPAVADVLYQNNGDGTFSDVTDSSRVGNVTPRYGFSAIFEDLDNDTWPDLLVTNDSGPNFLFHNTGQGWFEEVGLLAGIAYNRDGRPQANMGLALGDVGRDGFTDVFITTFAEDYYPFFRNQGDLLFVESAQEAGLAVPTVPFLGWATFFLDVDNDGTLDLFMANGHLYPQADEMEGRSYPQRDLLFRGLADGKFEEVGASAGLDEVPLRSSRGGAYCDYDNDGDLDILVLSMDDTPVLLRNEAKNSNHWLQLSLPGGKGSPRAGTRVRLTSSKMVQHNRIRSGGGYLSQNDLRVHFGLGPHTVADEIEVTWPGGKTVTLKGVTADRLLTVREP